MHWTRGWLVQGRSHRGRAIAAAYLSCILTASVRRFVSIARCHLPLLPQVRRVACSAPCLQAPHACQLPGGHLGAPTPVTSRDWRLGHATAAAGAATQLRRRVLRGRRPPRPPRPLAGPPVPPRQHVSCAAGRLWANGTSSRQQPPLSAAEQSALHAHGHGASARGLLCPRRCLRSCLCRLAMLCGMPRARSAPA